MSDLISYLTNIRFGVGSITELGEVCKSLNISTPLIVTDAGLVSLGIIADVIADGGLASSTVIFSDTPENPTEDAVERALKMYRDTGADGIVAVGGGSSIDLAKGVRLLSSHDGPLEQYAAIRGGVARIRPDMPPLIAIPTTAGTGSEVGRATLLTLRNERKLGFVSPNLIPSVAICDPNLTRSLPPQLTAATGMDAISHCIETYLSPKNNPVAEAIALDGLGRAWGHLRTAVEDGSNMTARTEMMMAALEGALAFQKGLGAIHSMSHALGGLKQFRLHHGALNAVFMPAVLRFNEPVCETKFAKIRDVLNLPKNADLATAFEGYNATLGMPKSLGKMGVTPNIIPQVAQWSFEDHSTATNPRPASSSDFEQMLTDTL